MVSPLEICKTLQYGWLSGHYITLREVCYYKDEIPFEYVISIIIVIITIYVCASMC